MKFQEISASLEKVEKCRASAPTDDRCPTTASLGASGSTRPRHRLFGLSLPQHAAFGAGHSSRSAGDIHFSHGKGRPTHIGSGASPSPFAAPKSPTYSFLHPPTAPDASPEASGAFFPPHTPPAAYRSLRRCPCSRPLFDRRDNFSITLLKKCALCARILSNQLAIANRNELSQDGF